MAAPAKKTTTATPRKKVAPKPVAAEAQAAEAASEATPFEFKGVTFEVPAQDDMPFQVLKAIRGGDEIEIVAAVLGVDQWQAFEDTNPTIREFQEFTELVAEAAGFGEEGNWPGPPSSLPTSPMSWSVTSSSSSESICWTCGEGGSLFAESQCSRSA